ALISICHTAGASIAGIGIAIEKGFQGGGDALRDQGYDLTSCAVIDRMDEKTLVFRPGT
ncbi:MAG: xanthine phosphoribosyltransferase, partial [bacterium]